MTQPLVGSKLDAISHPASDNAKQCHVDHSMHPRCFQPGQIRTWVNSQWKFPANPRQFSLKINALVASTPVKHDLEGRDPTGKAA